MNDVAEQNEETCADCGGTAPAEPRKLPDGWFMVRCRLSLLPVPMCGRCWASWEANSHG